MNSIIDALNWRYAVKQYDKTKKVSAEDIQTLKEAVRLTPTSAGLQPFRLIVVEDPAIKEKLAEVSQFNGNSVRDCSALFIFAAQTVITEKHIDDYLDLIVSTRGVQRSDVETFGTSMKSYLTNLSPEQALATTSNQTYIGLGILLTTAASLKIDATPMEGFEKQKYNEILGLTDHSVSVICTVGHRAETDAFQHFKKVRKPGETFFTHH